jgi:hypothetical protein
MPSKAVEPRPVKLLGCKVLQSTVEACGGAPIPATFMDYGLHRSPTLMRAALQRELDALPEPSLVLLAYGLCGNGLEGLQAGPHTLVVPRCHDCIALLLGSHDAYMREFLASPGTYYLSKGWLECGSHPLKEYEEYAASHGEKTARWLIGELYHNYTRVAFIASSPADLAEYAPRAREVAAFLGIDYVELDATDLAIRRLLDKPRTLDEEDPDFLVIGPGGEIAQMDFLR